jgi:Mg2+/Co2+ transporter CorC
VDIASVVEKLTGIHMEDVIKNLCGKIEDEKQEEEHGKPII